MSAISVLEMSNDILWPGFHNDEILISHVDGDLDWHTMMDTDDDAGWMDHVIPYDDIGLNNPMTGIYPTKVKRTSLDATETWLSEDDDDLMEILDDHNYRDLVSPPLNIEHEPDMMFLDDNLLPIKEWRDEPLKDERTEALAIELFANSDTKGTTTEITSTADSSSHKKDQITCKNAASEISLIPSTISASTNNDDVDVDEVTIEGDEMLTMIMHAAEDCSLDQFLVQHSKDSNNSKRRYSNGSQITTAVTLGSKSQEGALSTKSYHDIFEERRTQLAASMEASRRSRMLCFLQNHVKTRASLANVLRDIERSSRVVAEHVVRPWNEAETGKNIEETQDSECSIKTGMDVERGEGSTSKISSEVHVSVQEQENLSV